MPGRVYVKGYWRRKPVRKKSATSARTKRPRNRSNKRNTRSTIMRFLTS
jgi:hypothetical protein